MHAPGLRSITPRDEQHERHRDLRDDTRVRSHPAPDTPGRPLNRASPNVLPGRAGIAPPMTRSVAMRA